MYETGASLDTFFASLLISQLRENHSSSFFRRREAIQKPGDKGGLFLSNMRVEMNVVLPQLVLRVTILLEIKRKGI